MASALTTASCLLEKDRCAENQIEAEGSFRGCSCAPNAYPNPVGYGCIACPADQMVKGNACVCMGALVKNDAGSCVEGPPPAEGGVEGDAGSDAATTQGPPTGQGSTCTTSADCVNYEASYCVASAMACAVDNCQTQEVKCYTGYTCCTIAALSTARGMSICISPERLAMFGGNCPAGGTKVPE